MSMPIQRQSDTYGAFDDGSHRFAKDYETHDLPEGLVGMLAGRRISAGLNDPRRMQREADADPDAAWGQVGDTLGDMGTAIGDGEGGNRLTDSQFGDLASGTGHALAETGRSLVDGIGDMFSPNTVQGTPTAPPGVGTPTPTNINAYRQGGFGAYPDSNNFAREDLSGHGFDDGGEHLSPPEEQFGQDPSQHIPESYVDQAPPTQDPGGFGFGGYEDYDPHSSENLPPDYGAQFGPHMSSFTTAHSAEGGPAPKQPVTAAAVQPQVVPGWVGHGYSPGHRVGLPWRDQVIPGTVTHLPGQEVGVRWDDGQHSTEEPSDLRPI